MDRVGVDLLHSVVVRAGHYEGMLVFPMFVKSGCLTRSCS